MLFLGGVHGADATLFGHGDVGLWPRAHADWVFSAGHVQPLDRVEVVVSELLRIDALKSYQDRASALIRPPFTDQALGRIAALQYVGSTDRWPQGASQGPIRLVTIRSLLAARTLLDVAQFDFAEDVALIPLLPDLPRAIAIPKLVERLAHPDVAIRDTAYAVLRRLAGDDTLRAQPFDPRAPDADRNAAVGRWKQWQQANQTEWRRKEAPLIITGLRSGEWPDRALADLLLRLLSGHDMGFEPQAPESQREPAIGRWENWWNTTAMLP
jgi:hypothetical protein